jgi:urease accessory protein
MFTVTSIVGNVYHDKKLRDIFNQKDSIGNCERLKISRLETEKKRFRQKTDQGTDVGLILDSNMRLRHGDVIVSNSKKFIIIEQLPEKVLTIRLKKNTSNLIEVAVMLGHIIGNRHKPILIDNDLISFPIQSDSEVEIFKKLFNDIMSNFDLTIKQQIFQPQLGLHLHEH